MQLKCNSKIIAVIKALCYKKLILLEIDLLNNQYLQKIIIYHHKKVTNLKKTL